MDYDTMEAGREMDALVAEKVMGWKVVYHDHANGRESDYSSAWIEGCPVGRYLYVSKFQDYEVWSPSTCIKAAWEVADKIWHLGFSLEKGQTYGDKWQCELMRPEWITEKADTAPLAICRAALKAVT